MTDKTTANPREPVAHRNWTMADLNALMDREGGNVQIYHYLDGRDVAHIKDHAWIWNSAMACWVFATKRDMEPSSRGTIEVVKP